VACSGAEYGPIGPGSLPVTEEHPLRPQSPYAASKAAVDLLAGFYADAFGLKVVRTRAFNHAGPGQTDDYVVSTFARQIAVAEANGGKEGKLTIETGDIDVRRDFTDVRDVVRAYAMALEAGSPGQVYNVCQGQSIAVAEILAELSRHTDLEIEQRTDPARLRLNEARDFAGSSARLTEATGWRPEIPLSETVSAALEWWRVEVRSEGKR
jgi:GDP-4-dehydro-6-deoxy-D-mannose reductase